MPQPQHRGEGLANLWHIHDQKDDPMTAVGDIVGTNADTAKAALEKAGCPVNAFESEDGKIEAICTDAATSKKMDITIDPANGAILTIKGSND